MKDGIMGKKGHSSFVLLDLRFIILIAEPYNKNKMKRNQTEMNQIPYQSNAEVK